MSMVLPAMWHVLAVILAVAAAVALAARRAPSWLWAVLVLVVTLAAQTGLLEGHLARPAFSLPGLLAWLPALAFAGFSVPPLRRRALVVPAFRSMRGTLPRLSDVVRQSAFTGTVGFDAELFGGRPDWDKLRAVPPVVLSEQERAFLDGPVEQLCGMIDDWQIRHD